MDNSHKIDYSKYKIKYPKTPKPNTRGYKKMLRKVRREFKGL